MPVNFEVNLGGNFVESIKESNKALDENKKELTDVEKATKGFDDAIKSTEAKLQALKADPAKFKKLADAQHALAQESKKLGGEQDSLKEKLEALSSTSAGGFTFDMAEGARGVYEIFSKIGETIVEVGRKFFDLTKEIVGSSAALEDLNLAVELDVGKKGLNYVDQLVNSFESTRFDDDDLKKALLPLLEESGLKHSENFDFLLTAATDIATRKNAGVAGVQAALEAFQDIDLKPQKIGGALKALGIKQTEYYSSLAALNHISVEAQKKLVQSGKADPEQLLNEALFQVQQRQGGALGLATNRGSDTLGASVERLAHVKDDLFKSLAGSPAMKEVQRVIDNIVEAFRGDLGKDLINSLGEIIHALAEVLTPEKIKGFIGYVTEAVKSLASPEGIGGIVSAFESVLTVVASIGKALKGMVDLFQTATGGMQALIRATTTNEVGHGLVGDGKGETADSNKAAVANRALKLSSLSVEAAAPLVAQSAQQFGFSPEDFAAIVASLRTKPANSNGIPKMAEGGIVSSPTLALIGEAGPEAVVPLRKMGGMGDVNVNLNFGGTPTAEDAEAIGRAVRIEILKFVEDQRAAMG